MNSFIKYFLFITLLLFSYCLCELSDGQKEKLFNGFVEYYNNLPNQIYQCNEGSLESAQEVDGSYQIVANIRATEISNIEATKLLRCTATVQLSDDGVTVTVTNSNCQEPGQQSTTESGSQEALETQVEITEPIVDRNAVRLDNEVQLDITVTSGEQFIAIPRDNPSPPCAGCASHVNPEAAGVRELANLGVRHLDIHEPSVEHSLGSVINVERQVQVVNGVRYILTLSINSNNCTGEKSEDCVSSKICKITVLVKPRVKLPNGQNYRAILANNCTEEWQYGDNGEVLPELSSDNNQNKGNMSVDHDNINTSNDDIRAIHNTNVQFLPSRERTLTDEELKNLQEQIITETTEPYMHSVTASPNTPYVSKQHVFKFESGKHNENSIPVTEQQHSIYLDKKKAIDDMLEFFDFAGFKPKTVVENGPRVRRSYDYDLQVLSLAEDFHGIKNSIENARFMYEMAQAMVDYLNEIDIEVKNRAIKNVVRAEEEKENLQRFVYVQARVTIPCDKVECKPSDEVNQICNGVIDSTNENRPQILNTFCYNDNKERDYRDVIKEVALDDPVLQNLAEEALKKIESESNSQFALKINKIASATTQVASGTLTKFTIIVENLKCNKGVPLALRINCTVLHQLGSKICEVIMHERHWLKERKITYTCTERPVDMRISKAKKNITVDDPKIIDMLQEALQYLETQSDKNNKQKIVSIKSISSQIVAGFLTKIEFDVGYTNCTDETYSRDQLNICELIKDEEVRSCKAQIWDRSWIMDGRQIEVSCDDIVKSNEIHNTRKKRSIDFTGDQDKQNKSKDLEYKEMAIESLNRFMQSSPSRQHYEVLKVDKVMVQDVSGKLIRIFFSISPTNCHFQKNGHLSSSKCNIVNSKNIFHCRSKILDKAWIDKKQYFVNCKIKDHEQQTDIEGLNERNPGDPKYYMLAEESLVKYLNDTANPPDHGIVKVVKVTTQIVSGLLTTIDFIISPMKPSNTYNKTINCHSKILEKHWLGTRDFDVSCQMNKKKIIYDMVEHNVNNPKYMQMAVESLETYIQDKPESHLVRVTFVDKVVQAGKNIKLQFLASHAEDDDGDTLCYAELSETKLSRNDIKVKCHLIGAILKKTQITKEDPNYYKYVQLAEDSLHNHLQSLNNSELYTIVSIESITVLWDEGIKTVIDFIISPVDVENSKLLEKQCLAEIYEQPWVKKQDILVSCGLDDYHRSKRHLVGGLEDQNPTDPRFKALAKESLQKYKIESGITYYLEVAHVEKVTTQVVAGIITRIDFLVSSGEGSELMKCHSSVWEKPWENFTNIEVSCQNDGHRGKRQLVGGPVDQNPTDPRFKALAEESLRKYKIESGITYYLEVAHVEKVTTQVVSGSMTRIDFHVSGSKGSVIFKCHSEVWEQLWLNKKDIKVSCLPINDRIKRKVVPLGGETEQDPTDPVYRELAEESLQKYKIESGITYYLEVAHVEKVTTQVVAGSLTRIDFHVSGSEGSMIFKCHSEVWEQLWLKKKDIKVSCLPVNHRVRRDEAIYGGITEQDPTDPVYRKLVEESLQKYKIESGITYYLEVAHVEKVTTQVVAGIITRIDFLVSSGEGSELMKCHSSVWEKPWENFTNIEVSCQNDGHRGKRQLVGGPVDQNPTDPRFKALAEESLRKYKIESGITYYLEVAHVEKVTTQVVSGSMTRIDFHVSGSEGSVIFKCHSEVWEQLWLKKKDIKVSCLPVNHRVRRDEAIYGGITEQDPTDPVYRKLVEESLQKYKIESGITYYLEVAHVEKVTTQVVAGIITRIDFLVSSGEGSELMKCHSSVWEKPWENFTNIEVSCQNDGHRGKRQLVGGPVDQNPTDPRFKALAEESLRKYKIESGITYYLEVAHVEKVTTQVVSGSMTRIDFHVSGSKGSVIFKCHSEVWEQLWLNKKDIKVSCLPINDRIKRKVVPLGGETEQDPTDPVYRELAEESLQKYKIESGITYYLEVAHVEKVTTQVVAGSLTRIDFHVSGSEGSMIFKCHSEVWEQLWLKKKDIKVSCLPVNHRVRRDEAIYGGITEQDPTDPVYRKLVEESLQKYKIESGITYYLEVAHVEKVTTQVVAGIITRIDFLVSSGEGSELMKCHSSVWEKPWENFTNIEVSCQNDGHRGKRQLVGGPVDQNPTDPRFKALAEESLRKYKIESGITYYLEVAHVEKVTTQVVSGSMTRIDFHVSGSEGSVIFKCHSEVWEQLWLNKKDIKVSCLPINDRIKRKVVPLGGETEQDPTDPVYRELAEESLQKYKIESGITYYLEVAHVEKVTTQVVAGSLTRIDFHVSGSEGSMIFKCHSEVWEQLWLNKKDIKVSCLPVNHRVRRDEAIYGGITEQDPTDPVYRKLVEVSLQKYKIESGITYYLEVAHVEKVTTQVVAGIITRIDFLVSSGEGSELMKCHSSVWEKPWENFTNIEVSCQNDGHRGKRQLVGGPVDQNPTDPRFKALAEESLRKYKIESGITYYLEVAHVEKVTTQVVSGSMTRIDFHVSGSDGSVIFKCHSEVWEQLWLNKKDIKVSCLPINDRIKRKVVPLGGETEQDPTDPVYRELAEESLQKYKIESGITYYLEVAHVEKVTTQVVAGSLTRIDFHVSGSEGSMIFKCHSEAWEQLWLNKKDIKVSCLPVNHRVRRDEAIYGGITEQDPTDPVYRKLVEESLQKYKIESGITYYLEVAHVEKVTTQVVAGIITRIDFLVSSGEGSELMKCHSSVWEKPWENFTNIEVSCQNDGHRGKRQLVGGPVDQNPTDPRFKALAEESLRKYKIESGITYYLEVAHVEKVTTQVVSGSMTRIDFHVSGSDGSVIFKCHSEVWEQLWLNKKDIKVSCLPINDRIKRKVVPLGGETEQDPTDPVYRELAEESLQKYKIESGITYYLEVAHVEKVTTQVVAGSLTRIDFHVSGSEGSMIFKCHSEVWEQLWLNKKDIKVSCLPVNHRVRRDEAIYGGITEQDPTDPVYRKLVEESLQKYKIESGITYYLEVAHVEKVTTQVVAGIITRIDFLVSSGEGSELMKCHSSVWEKPWENFTNIEVSCQNDGHRGKRQLVGGPVDQNPTDPRFKALAEESLRKYKIESGITYYLEVAHVEKVTTQVVSGSMTRIDFHVSGSKGSVIFKCHSEVWEQLWLNKKDIKVSCLPINDRIKRKVVPLGGETEQDPTDPVYRELAEESLQKYKIESGITYYLEVAHVEKVTTQVVAGSLTRIDFHVSGSEGSMIFKCHSEVWEQLWLNKKDIKVSCQDDGHRAKRHLVGGPIDQNPTDPIYKALAEESLQKYKIESGITYYLEVAHVEKVTTQVVAGSMTRIDFHVSGSDGSVIFKCHSEVWEQLWLNKKDIKVSCLQINDRIKRKVVPLGGETEQDPTDTERPHIKSRRRVKRNLGTPSVPEQNQTTFQYKVLGEELAPGNDNKNGKPFSSFKGNVEEEQDPKKPEYKLLAEESLLKYQRKSSVFHKVVEVKRVMTRIVSGLKYKIDFSAAPTDCSVNVSSALARSCEINDDVILYCHTEIWSRPWLKQKEIDVNCYVPTYDNDNFEDNESDIFFSLKPDPKRNNNKKYIKLAEEASEKYLTKSNRKYIHKVTEIHSVRDQIADGLFTNIEYSLSPTTCLRNDTTNNLPCKLKQPLIVFHCIAKIKSRPWSNRENEVKVTCKKNSKQKDKKIKSELAARSTRQISDDDDEMDEDTTYYYADRAIQHLNDKSTSNNLHKLISIHAVQSSIQMGTLTVQMYIEVAETFCLRHHKSMDLRNCEEMNGLNHRLCLARLWPSPDDELVVRHLSVVCDDDEDFVSITGVNIPELLRLSIVDLERAPDAKYKLVHQGEPQVIPSLDSKLPFKVNFIVATTNCSKDVNLDKNPFQCYINTEVPSKPCRSFIWLKTETKLVRYINAKCSSANRAKRSVLDSANTTLDNLEIQNLVQASLEKLEMSSLHRYKQRVLQINSYSTKITSGKVITIDFDVGYTSCLKYEWVENITSCDFLEHLPRRRCVAQIWERLWINNGKNIDVNCVDDETPLESHIEFESAEMANELAREALKHIEAKYPHPSKQKIVRIFSLEKQVVAGIHYKMKVEVGFTDCVALSDQTDCKFIKNQGLNKFCRVNVWVRPWTDHPPNFRVSCDFQEGTTHDLYHHIQAEHLFYNFLTTYNPSYVNDYNQMQKRFEIFKKNVKKIHEFNVHEKGTAVYGVTRFTDLTYQEFSDTYMGLKTNLSNENQVPMKKADIPEIKVPANFDWREHDAVTEVKDQGSCGSCWAFSVTGNIEGQWKMQSGKLLSLSEQELVDCDKLDQGCNGGLPDNAYRAIEQMGGLELENDYPYEGVDDKCVFNKTLAKVQISGAVNITSNETGMAQWLVQNGPISIGINANAMQFYMGGISHPWKMLCDPTNLDHGVLIVGYGIKDYPLFHKKLPYWIIKNSWGQSWGEQGYYRVYRGDGTCGVNQMASSAVI